MSGQFARTSTTYPLPRACYATGYADLAICNCVSALLSPVVAVSPGDTEPYYNLGSYHRAVDTASAQAQMWVDRGMVWAYAFNHEEAVRCFEKALSLDPDLAIARWGIAYSV